MVENNFREILFMHQLNKWRYSVSIRNTDDTSRFHRIQKVIFLAVHNIKPNSSFPQSESKRIQSIASTLNKIIV